MKKKHRNQLISRLLAMCLAAVMMLSMGITASAALTENSTYNFTVSGFDTTTSAPTVTAYQIIKVNIDDVTGQPEYPMYTWAGPVADWLKKNKTYEKYIDTDLGENAVADVFKDAQAADMTKFLEELAAAIKDNTANAFDSLVKKDVSASNGTASFPDMAMGEYLIIASGGVKIYKPTTVKLVPEYDKTKNEWGVGDAVVAGGGAAAQVKGSAPQIEKTVLKNGSSNTADRTTAIGDTVTFKLAADVPDYPEGAKNKTFIISDTVGTGLEYIENSIKVYSDETLNTEKEVSPDKYYDVKTDWSVPDQPGTTRTFAIEFNDTFFEEYSAYPKVYVTYDAKVTSDAFKNNTNGVLNNDAYLGYSNNPYDKDSYTEGKDSKTVYTYAINLTKVDTNGDGITGIAKFELKNSKNETLYFTGSNGVYYKYDSSNDASTQGATKDLTTSSTGTLKLQGLDAGIYTLTETEAPDGYVLPNGSIKIEIEDANESGGPDGTIDRVKGGNVEASGGAEIYVAEGAQGDGVTINYTTISFEVVNKTADQGAFTLPVTGGAGTVIFTMAGILLMGGAVALLVVVLRRKRS